MKEVGSVSVSCFFLTEISLEIHEYLSFKALAKVDEHNLLTIYTNICSTGPIINGFWF